MLLAAAWLAGCLGAISLPGAARAATAECIPAARFSVLARIADGSMSQFAELLGLPGQSPPDDGCYAVLLSGPIDRGSAASLTAAIERNKGWLAQVYIAVWDGDLGEEAALAHLMRDFKLTGVLLTSGDYYAPDVLVPPQPLPASVSNGWPETDLPPRQPLALSFKDYLENTDRKIAPASRPCGAGCWSILAGAIEQRWRLPVGPAAPESPGILDDPQAMHMRDRLRAELGAGFGLIKAVSGYRPMPRLSRFVGLDRGPIEKDCRSALDYANAIEGDIAKASNALAAKGFPFMRLVTLTARLRRFQDAAGKAELCMRKGLARMRMTTFRARCSERCKGEVERVGADADAMRQTAKPAADARGAPAPSPAVQAPEDATRMQAPAAQGPASFVPKLRPQRPR